MFVPTPAVAMKPWRVYGRDKEIKELEQWCLSNYGFMAGAVIGRRGVGKTQLLKDVQARVRGRRPMVLIELPERPAPDERERTADGLRMKVDEIAADPETRPILTDFSPDLQSEDALANQLGRLSQMTEHCLRKGAIVALDEFHNARRFGMESEFKRMIDEAGSVTKGRWPGQLVVAGSHQQQLIDMIAHPRAPLYQRFMKKFRLRPLRAPALLEMAAEQGWLDDPRRFLTLATVFGGVPRLWERHHAELQARPPDTGGFPEWRRAFLIREVGRLRADPEERWDWKGLVELQPVTRSILETVVGRNPRGTLKSFIAETCRPSDMDTMSWRYALDHHLAILESHLEMVAPVRVPGIAFRPPPAARKIRIIDPSTLFQLLLRDESDLSAAEVVATADQGLRMTEGFALERLTVEWLEALPGVARAAANVQPGTVGIDVLALSDRADWVGMFSCKRSAGRHDPKDTEQQFHEFLEEMKTRQGWVPPAGARIEQFLVSPLFEDAASVRSKAPGFQLADIRGMARKLGFDPGPRAAPDHAPETEPPSPSFGTSALDPVGPGEAEPDMEP